jgi:3-oxoadipate enol-lactonase
MITRGENNSIHVGDIEVSYSDVGPDHAPVVLFIHGFPFTRKIWEMQVEALRANYRVISYDIRGHGQTTAGSKPFSIETFTDDLLGLMDVLKLNQVNACGISMGGYILLQAQIRFPERFKTLVLASTQCRHDLPEEKKSRAKAIKNIEQLGTHAYADSLVKKLFSPRSFTARKEEVRTIHEIIRNTSAKTLCNTLRALAERQDTCDNLRNITIPALILAGEEDTIINPEASWFLHQAIPQSVIQIVSSSAHLSNLENTHEFNTHLKTFLDSINAEKETLGVSGSFHNS